MKNPQLKQLRQIFSSSPEVKLGYFFGSRARGDSGPLSDYDFAVYIDDRDPKTKMQIKLDLLEKLSLLLKTDKIDLVILDHLAGPELQYEIIREGKLIYEVEPYKIIVEPRIMNLYFDFHDLLVRHNLTKA